MTTSSLSPNGKPSSDPQQEQKSQTRISDSAVDVSRPIDNVASVPSKSFSLKGLIYVRGVKL
jgi:hypothetical protein